MKIDTRRFRVPDSGSVDLARWPTRVDPYYGSHEDYDRTLAQHVATLAERQTLPCAHDRCALLIVLQAMDAAGKDGVIKRRCWRSAARSSALRCGAFGAPSVR